MEHWTKPSNFEVVVESNRKEHLAAAVKLIMTNEKLVEYYLIRDNKMSFFWHKDGNDGTHEGKAVRLPFIMDVDALIEFIWGWLRHSPRNVHPDIDGSAYADGFRVDTVGSHRGWQYEVFHVVANWSLFHK